MEKPTTLGVSPCFLICPLPLVINTTWYHSLDLNPNHQCSFLLSLLILLCLFLLSPLLFEEPRTQTNLSYRESPYSFIKFQSSIWFSAHKSLLNFFFLMLNLFSLLALYSFSSLCYFLHSANQKSSLGMGVESFIWGETRMEKPTSLPSLFTR